MVSFRRREKVEVEFIERGKGLIFVASLVGDCGLRGGISMLIIQSK